MRFFSRLLQHSITHLRTSLPSGNPKIPHQRSHTTVLEGIVMKTLLMAVLLGSLLVVAGCSKKSSNNPLTPTLPATPSVAFTMHMESGTQGMIFVASPSADVRLQKVVVAYPPAQFTNTVTNPDPSTLIEKGSNIQIGEYTGVEMHQIWVLTFVGSDPTTNRPFTVTMNWEVI